MKLSSNYPRTDVYFIFYKSILRNKKFLYHKLSTKDINLSILFFPFIKLFTQNLIIYSLLKGNENIRSLI